MIKKLIVSNWKNYVNSPAQAEEILERVNDYLESLGETKEFSLVFCPPAEFLESVGKILAASHFEHQSSLGAQDMTDIASRSVRGKINAQYVIIGHSDRRYKLGETDEMVNQKLKVALADEIIPIVCIGEKTRDEGFEDFLKEQTLRTFDGISADDVAKCIIAYEPVWAISAEPNARPDTPESALESIKVIKNTLIGNLPKVLYGGSVNSKNIADFLKQDKISGALIGSASVDKEEFIRILSVVGEIQ